MQNSKITYTQKKLVETNSLKNKKKILFLKSMHNPVLEASDVRSIMMRNVKKKKQQL